MYLQYNRSFIVDDNSMVAWVTIMASHWTTLDLGTSCHNIQENIIYTTCMLKTVSLSLSL